MSVLIGEGDPAARLEVRVCDGLSCAIMGAPALLGALQRGLAPAVQVRRASCMGRCDKAPVAAIGHYHLEHATAEGVVSCVQSNVIEPVVPRTLELAEYEHNGGYQLYRTCLAGERTPDDVIAVIEASGLRGLGGDGVPTGSKWRAVREQPAPRLMVVNASEAEPGSFKDRVTLERDPHRVFEGALIAAWAVGAGEIFVVLRAEYAALHAILGDEIAKLAAAGLPAATRLHLRRATGGYRAGEETTLIASLERHGARQSRPTLVNNVESLAWVRDIIERGAAWFAGQGRHGAKGLRAYSVSGRVKEPGLKLAPAGITMNELLEAYCEGMADGHRFQAYLVGGATGRFLPASKADIPLDFDRLKAEGATIGTGAIVVLSDRDDLNAAARHLQHFIETETSDVG